MEARIKLLKNLSRMCRETSCIRCPIRHLKADGSMQPCINIFGKYPEEIIKIVDKWVQTHPEKTFLDDIKEKFPDMTLGKDGLPDVCPYKLGYCKEEEISCDSNCMKCWKQPLKNN